MATQEVPLPSDEPAIGGEPLLPGSIEQYLVTSVPVCTPSDSVGVIRSAMLGTTFGTIADVAVCEEIGGSLALRGLIPVERLLAARDDETAGELMDADPPVVAPGLAQEKRVPHPHAGSDSGGASRFF